MPLFTYLITDNPYFLADVAKVLPAPFPLENEENLSLLEYWESSCLEDECLGVFFESSLSTSKGRADALLSVIC